MTGPRPSGPGSWALDLSQRAQDVLADNANFDRADAKGRIPFTGKAPPPFLGSLRRRGLLTWPADVVNGRAVSFLTEKGLEARAFLLIHRRRHTGLASAASLQSSGAPAACADAPEISSPSASPGDGGATPSGTGGDL